MWQIWVLKMLNCKSGVLLLFDVWLWFIFFFLGLFLSSILRHAVLLGAFDRFYLYFDLGKTQLLVYFVKFSYIFYHLLLLTTNWVIFILPWALRKFPILFFLFHCVFLSSLCNLLFRWSLALLELLYLLRCVLGLHSTWLRLENSVWLAFVNS